MRVPGGAPPAWVWGVRGRALSHLRPLVRSGVRPGPDTHWLWVWGMWAWGPITNPTARALDSRLCALWGQHEGARRGRLLPGCGASGVGRSPTPDLSSVRACGRGPLPTGCGCGGCGHGDPSSTPQRALLRAGFARCGGGMRVPGGGRILPGCGASRVRRSPTPDLSSFWACGRGPLPTGCGCGGCGRGDPSPTPQRTLLRAGFARCGGGTRAPGGGASCLHVERPGTGALPPPTSRPFGRAAGAHYPLAVGAGDAGVGTRHQPYSALLLAGFARCGGGMRVPGGGASWFWWGVRGRALSQPRPLVRSGMRPGPTTHWLWVRGMRAWGPVTNRTACALACCGGGMRVPGAGTSCLGVGRPGSGALPPPTTRAFGCAAGAHYPQAVGARGAGVGTRHQPHSARSCELALRAVGAARGRPGEAPVAWVWGVRGRALSHPRPLVLSGVRPGPTTHWLWVRGLRAWGPVTNPKARSCELALRAVRAA